MATTKSKKNPAQTFMAKGGAQAGKAWNTIASPVQNLVSRPPSSKNGDAAPKEAAAPADENAPKEADKQNGQKGNKTFFQQPQQAFNQITKGGENLMNAMKSPFTGGKKGTAADGEQEDEDVPDVPPDSKLQNMNVIIKKRLKGVTVKDFYETVWSEGNRTDKDPFYGPWLEKSGKNNVKVEDWTFAGDEGVEKIVGDWDGEEYSQKRTATFRFTRTTHLYTGPPEADVKHTQYCRVDGEDRCILAMTVEMDGIPFADCFNVEIRWVASRVKSNDLLIEVGLFVNFIKSTLVASKIKAGTTEETTKGQLTLFEAIKGACHAEAEETEEEKEEEIEVGFPEAFSCSALGDFLSVSFGGRGRGLLSRDEELGNKVRGADKKLHKILQILQKTEDFSESDKDVIRAEIDLVNESLKKMLKSIQ